MTIHIKTTEGGLIKEPSILLEYTNRKNAYPLQRMLKHRKVDQQFLASRKCEEDEVEECSHPHRVGFVVYRDWDLLIADEKNFTEDQDWFSKLEELKRRFPQFDRKEGANDH